MEELKPYAYCFKHVSEPAKLKATFICIIPANERLQLRSGDPVLTGNTYQLRYDRVSDPSHTHSYQQFFEKEFSWNGSESNIEIIVGDGSGGGGGTSHTNTAKIEEF